MPKLLSFFFSISCKKMREETVKVQKEMDNFSDSKFGT